MMRRYLHVANGTCTTGMFAAARVPGRSSIWADALHDGPVPAGIDDNEMMAVRARVIAEPNHDVEAVAGDLRRWREVIDERDEYDELVLWYEHDLFDQLNLIQLLSRLGASGPWPAPVTMICIGSFPGRPAFKGLGELTPAELGPLFETRQPVTEAQYALARNAWTAFRSPDPTAIETVIAGDTSALPFLAAALARHLEEFPWTRDGLSRTERRMLSLAADGPIPLRTAFPRMHDGETAFYIADSSVQRTAATLAGGRVPLLTETGHSRPSASMLEVTIEATADGRAVLAGRKDRVAMSGIDRWLGGVHLAGDRPHWRWDARAGRIVKL